MNFGLRLDEILCDTLNGEGVYREYSGKVKAAGQVEAKQSITSLIKELVAEAKPTNSVTQRGSITVYGDLSERDLKIVNQFEQNLLKALETRE